jgi:hypothetical protein
MVVTGAMALAVGTLDAQRAPALPQRVAAYVRVFVDDLANVVAQEDFVFREGPQKTVRSDLLLVQYPGSQQSLMTFRDVAQVNGADLPSRKEHLSDLFERSFFNARARAASIAASSAPYVPPVLNPLFGIAFLQEEYQARFRLSEQDAGDEWPDTVKAITFVETRKPTLLRSGRDGDVNAPSRGTAWVESQTGRVLRTEIQVQGGKSQATITKITTIFARNERLGVMAPTEMRTERPGGVATYSNFRHFDVKTDERLKSAATIK